MTWPKQDYASMVKFFGQVGENQTKITLPFPMICDWEPFATVKSITCHEKVADSLLRILKKVRDEYGPNDDALRRFGGCLNVRKMRGGTSWSIHSWGAAVDLDPEQNQLRWNRTKARLSAKKYVPFWDIVAGEGWVSLGQMRDYDWMHFQAATL